MGFWPSEGDLGGVLAGLYFETLPRKKTFLTMTTLLYGALEGRRGGDGA